MPKFKIIPKNKLPYSIIGLLTAAVTLTGCGLLSKKSDSATTGNDEQAYCYNGGRTNEYSCDPEKSSPQANMHTNEIDDEWLAAKLAEVRQWLKVEKQHLLEDSDSEVTHQATNKPEEYISTVSITGTASKQPVNEIEYILRLSHKKKHKEALAGVNSLIAENPKVAAAELTKGIVLNNMGDKEAAKALFKRLTIQYPDRPEPFNNLAVIFAEEGKYPQAIETLQQAFSTHPSYAQVHSNLKELYATLASQAYSKALDLGESGTGPSLAMINRVPVSNLAGVDQELLIVNNQSTSSEQQQVAANSEAEAPAVATPKPVATEVAEIEHEIKQPEVSAKTVEIETARAETTTIATPEVVDITSKSESDTSTQAEPATVVQAASATLPEVVDVNGSSQNPEQAVEQHLNAWADAWGKQDVEQYISSYTSYYRPNSRLNHSQWVAQRKVRVAKPKFIRIEIDSLSIKMLKPNVAQLTFEQRYQSDTYKDAVRKRVIMTKTNGEWKIYKERSLGLIQ